jgi:hypothetical protein
MSWLCASAVSDMAIACSQQTKLLGLLDIWHYNFRRLEIYYYNSYIRKYAITILSLFEICQFIRIWFPWTYVQTYMSSYGQNCPATLHSLTRG